MYGSSGTFAGIHRSSLCVHNLSVIHKKSVLQIEEKKASRLFNNKKKLVRFIKNLSQAVSGFTLCHKDVYILKYSLKSIC